MASLKRGAGAYPGTLFEGYLNGPNEDHLNKESQSNAETLRPCHIVNLLAVEALVIEVMTEGAEETSQS